MNSYQDLMKELCGRFDESKFQNDLQDPEMEIRNLGFESPLTLLPKTEHCSGSFQEDSFEGNLNFCYPVFRHKMETKNRRVIILMHGLNEKRWYKYLPWAYTLAKQTGKDVILFPFSFHINRAPGDWSNVRVMNAGLEKRLDQFSDLENASVANLALSERLTNSPQKFLYSGYQSAIDIGTLTKSLQGGQHPLYPSGVGVDVFSYSIGVLLNQVLMIANPEGMFNNSRFFIFAGGSAFEAMNGSSRLIMDNVAFKRIWKFYAAELDEQSKKDPLLNKVINQTAEGEAFRAMISLKYLKDLRKKVLKQFEDQIQVIALQKDKVIPLDGIRQIFGKLKPKVLDFVHPYSHENPFPLKPICIANQVDNSFKSLFDLAGRFLG
jgi:Family of unknown function (DUF6051)